MVGDEHIQSNAVEAIDTDLGTLRLLTPTDCVKDRLANYYYFGDKQCLEQALLVAKAHPINISSLESWHKNEGQTKKLLIFLEKLKDAN
jgi:hypothetical protein